MTISPLYVKLFVALLVLVVSLMTGQALARRLRMPDHGWRLAA